MFKDTPRPTTVFGNSCRGRRRGGGRCSFEVQAVRGRGQYQSPAGTAATCAWNKMINIRTRRSRSIGICSFCRFAPYLPVIGAVQARRSGAGRCFEVSLARCPDTGENGISFGSSVVSIHSLRPRVLEQTAIIAPNSVLRSFRSTRAGDLLALPLLIGKSLRPSLWMCC